MKNLFDLTSRPDREYFYSRNDPDDRRLGEVVQTEPEYLEQARFVILGCPQDEGVRRNKGRTGAAKAPGSIRKQLYKFPVPDVFRAGSLFDIGDTKIGQTLEETHSNQYSVVKELLAAGKYVISLGGGNDISWPDGKGFAELFENKLFFNIDSHYDVRSFDEPNSGTPYRQLLESGLMDPAGLYQIANKDIANSPVYKKYLEEKGATIINLDLLRKTGAGKFFDIILRKFPDKDIFWGFDIDAVRTMDAPGASASYPVGLTADEICVIASAAGKTDKTRIFEISEVNPDYDIDDRTSRLAAMMIVYYLSERYKLIGE